MYSVVLAMAMTSYADTPALGRHGCHGCHGGGHSGRHHSCHGCSGGCQGGGGYGGCGGGYGGGYGGCGGGYGGGVIMGGGHAYMSGGMPAYAGSVMPVQGGGYATGTLATDPSYGNVIPASGTSTSPSSGSDIPRRKSTSTDADKESRAPSATTIIVSLPAEAALTIDGAVTTSTSATRTFVTPALQGDGEYAYTLKASIVRDGKMVERTKQVTFGAGSTVRVNFDFAGEPVASR